MQKKNLSLIAFILLIVFVVFSFMPVILKYTRWEENKYGHYTEGYSGLESFVERGSFRSITGILVYACILFAIIGIVALILQYTGKTSNNLNMLTFSTVISAGAFILFSLLYLLPERAPGWYSPYGYIGYTPGWGYYIEIALILAVAVMSILIATGKVKNVPVKGTEVDANVDVTEMLQKYKNLLDDGVINQEEFDAKKKQLLNL